MKLATSTGDFDRYADTYLKRTEYVYKAGFRNIDLSLYDVKADDELIISDKWEYTAEALLEYAEKNSISFVQSHSPNTNPLDKAQFEKAVKWNIRAIEICGKLGIPNIVIHSGWEKDITKEDWHRRNKEFFEKLFDTMEKYNVNVLHENTASVNIPWFYPKTGKEMREFSEYVNHPLFHSCWDTGHANIEGSQYNEILTLGDDLKAVHINDNRGSSDEHLIPFFGTLNMDEIMHALKDIGFKGSFTFESGSTLRPEKYWLGDRHSFEKDCKLNEASYELQAELEKFMYSVGKHILSAYGEYED